jgi:hypothetical protein
MEAVHRSNEVICRKLLIIFGLIIIAVLAGYFIASSQNFYKTQGKDFFALWLAPKLLLIGKNPYNPIDWISAYEKFGANWVMDKGYLYPLPLAVLMVPIGALPVEAAAVIWIAFGILAVLFTTYLLLSRWKNNWRYSQIIPIAIGIFLFRSVLETLRLGQLDWLILLFLAVGLMFWEKQNWLLGGMMFALTVLKPQIGIPLIIFLSIWLLQRHKWSVIIGEGAVLFSIFFIGWLFNHSWLDNWLASGSGKIRANICCTPTLWGFSSMISGFNLDIGLVFGVLLTTFLCILSFFLLYQIRPEDSKFAIGLSIPAALLVSPYIWTYSQIILLIPILIIVGNLQAIKSSYLIRVTFPLLVSLFSSLIVNLSIEIGVDTISALVPIMIFIILLWFFSRNFYHRDKLSSSIPFTPH